MFLLSWRLWTSAIFQNDASGHFEMLPLLQTNSSNDESRWWICTKRYSKFSSASGTTSRNWGWILFFFLFIYNQLHLKIKKKRYLRLCEAWKYIYIFRTALYVTAMWNHIYIISKLTLNIQTLHDCPHHNHGQHFCWTFHYRGLAPD